MRFNRIPDSCSEGKGGKIGKGNAKGKSCAFEQNSFALVSFVVVGFAPVGFVVVGFASVGLWW